MQARIKATGQIIELCPYVYDIDGNDFLLEEVELLDNPNWQQVRINAAIAAMQGMLIGDTAPHDVALSISAVELADALVAELKRSDDVYAECRRMDAINTASVCENMTKIQKELQKKGGDQ
jgi:membrane-associated PAP2 superfamily phosphatase